MSDAIKHRNRGVFTVELFFYVLSFGLALVLRFFALDRWPLLDGEAGLALAAWRFARGLAATLRGHSPLLFHSNALLFFLSEGSDAQVRLLSTLVGSLMVLLPYGLRQRLGRTGAAAASLLLAISPSFTYFSRVADGNVVVAFCALGLLVTFDGYLKERRSAYVLAAIALLVLALLAGPSAYTLIVIWLTFLVGLRLWSRWSKDSALLDELAHAWRDLRADSTAWRKTLLLAALLFLALGTAFAFNPAGLQMTLDQFGQWLGSFAFFKGTPWYLGLQLLLMYEALPLLLGVAWFIRERASHDRLTLMLRHWLVFTVLFSIVPGYRPAHSVLLMLLPLILAAGQAIERLSQHIQDVAKQPAFWVLVALSLVILAAVYVQFVTYLAMPVTAYLLRILALAIFLISTYAMLWSWSGAQVPLRAAAVSLSLLLLLILVRSEIRLNYAHARDPLEPLVGETASLDVLKLAQYAAKLSSQMEGDPRQMDWLVNEKLEVPIGWYLRSFERVNYVSTLPIAPEAGAMILTAEAPAPARYMGIRFALRVVWDGAKQPVLEWLRWWLGLKTTLKEVAQNEVMLWVKSTQK